MVAPVDVFVYFIHPESLANLRELFESRSNSGSGRVLISLVQGEVNTAVATARSEVGEAPLGVVTSSESDALQAIVAGADEAMTPASSNVEDIILFLDRLRVRAGIRRESESHDRDFAQAEKLAALGTLVAGVAHELNNPLSTITLGLDVFRSMLLPDLEEIWRFRGIVAQNDALSSDEARELLNTLQSNMPDVRGLLSDLSLATDSVSQLVQDLRVFSRSNMEEEPTFFSPAAVIEQSIRLVRREFGPSTIVEQDYEGVLPELYLPRNRLAQVLTNLLVNAAHAIREVKREVHQIRVGARIDDQHIAISVTDTGPGIPEETLERIFDPFFTTKREGQGTGLGLSISRSIVQHMGGDLAVSSVYGDGATFICFLPLPTQAQVRGSSRLRRPMLSALDRGGIDSVLLIDDDDRVLRATSRALRGKYKVLIARDGQEACELLASGSHADAIVMELDLPEMDGLQFYAWLTEHHPELTNKVVVATAAQEREKFRDFLRDCTLVVLHKPLSTEALFNAVSAALQD